MDRDLKIAKAEMCTFWTRTYPMREFAIYAVGEGEKQYLRMDKFVSGATGRQAEHIVVNSGMTYVWNTWSKNQKEGVKFRNKPAPFMEYSGIDNIKHKDVRCGSWKAVKWEFIAPKNIKCRPVSSSEFEQDEEYTPVLKAYIDKTLSSVKVSIMPFSSLGMWVEVWLAVSSAPQKSLSSSACLADAFSASRAATVLASVHLRASLGAASN